MKIDIYTWEDDEGYKRQALYIDEVYRKYEAHFVNVLKTLLSDVI